MIFFLSSPPQKYIDAYLRMLLAFPFFREGPGIPVWQQVVQLAHKLIKSQSGQKPKEAFEGLKVYSSGFRRIRCSWGDYTSIAHVSLD